VTFAFGVILFALALGLSVAIHEFGHLLTAKGFGMMARRYFIGFGPKIWSFQRGETEYGLKAIPAGGFVDIQGFTHLEELAPEDGPRAFWRYPAWKRFIVLVSGSFTHFVIAFVVLYCTAVSMGLPTTKAIVGSVTRCVPDESKSGKALPCTGDAGPAYQAHLSKGDQILAIDGTKVKDYDSLVTTLRDKPKQTIAMTYKHDGHTRTISMTLPAVKRAPLPGEKKNGDGLATVGAIGVSPASLEQYGAFSALGATGSFTGTVIDATFGAIGRFPDKVPKLISAVEGHKRDPNGPISVVGASRIGGEAVAAGSWLFFLFLLASFNIFIGIFNLFPLLPLDGGHVAVLLFEKVRSWFARLRNRADPGRVDLAKLMPVTFVVIIIFGGISVLTILADVVNPISVSFQ
jgi:membrane-associated protease RseP (regulator of RpoE activity)